MLTNPTLMDTIGATSQSSGASSLSQLGDDYNKFLTLLTAQISNQDPLAPVDSTQFVAQLAQLSQVEQAVQTNVQLEVLNTQMSALMNLGGTDLLGREVSVNSNIMDLENGGVKSDYVLGTGAVEVSARITGPTGNLVRTLNGLPTIAGQKIAVDWDGLDDNGTPMLDGNYSIEIVAKDASGASVESVVSRSAVVEDVRFTSGQILFGLSGGEVVSSVTVQAAS